MQETLEAGIAVIGAGAIGRQHIEMMRGAAGCGRLLAIADPGPAAAGLAETLGVPYFADHNAMLDTIRPQGVIVATPNDTHAAVAVDCLERGIPLLLEKPVAETLDGARLIVAASQRTRVPVLVGHHRRHNGAIRSARSAIQSGMVGRPVTANMMATFLKPAEYFEAAWRRQAGGGPILINMIHDIDLLRFMLGEVAEVHALRSNAVRGFAVEDTGGALFRLTSGAVATIVVSDTAACPWNWDLVAGDWSFLAKTEGVDTHFIAGTEGSVSLPSLRVFSYRDAAGTPGWRTPLVEERLNAGEAVNPYVAQLRHFCRVIRQEEAPVITAEDGARTLAVTLAVSAAADGGAVAMNADGLGFSPLTATDHPLKAIG